MPGKSLVAHRNNRTKRFQIDGHGHPIDFQSISFKSNLVNNSVAGNQKREKAITLMQFEIENRSRTGFYYSGGNFFLARTRWTWCDELGVIR